MALATQPTAPVTVTVTSPHPEVTVDADADPRTTTLHFTPATWAMARTVTAATAADDAVDSGTIRVALRHVAAGGDYGAGAVAATLPVTVEDDDAAALTLQTSALNAPLAEGTAAAYTVALATQPTGEVTVAIASSHPSVTLATPPSPLTTHHSLYTPLHFDAATWNTPQAVTVSVAEDPDGVNEAVTLTHDPGGADYDGVADVAVPLTVTDDDARGLRISESSLFVPENGMAAYTVALTTQPTGPATVSVSIAGGGILVDVDPAAGNQTALRFTATDWATAKPVTVSFGNDQDTNSEVGLLSHAAAGADYTGVTGQNVTLQITDDDVAGLRVTPTTLTIPEGGTAVYTVRLHVQPSAAVTVTVGGANARVTADADPGTSGTQTRLGFSRSNWNVPQTVQVTAAETDAATTTRATLTHVASWAGEYSGLPSARRPSVAVTVEDADVRGLRLRPRHLIVPEAGTAVYDVALTTQPTGTVTVAVTSTRPGVTVDAAPAVGNQTTLRFTAATWATAQRVTAAAAADPDARDAALTLRHETRGADYGPGDVAAALPTTVTDRDVPGLTFDATGLRADGLPEGGSGTYTVALNIRPTGPVRVALRTREPTVTVDADVRTPGDQAVLAFTARTWATARTVRVQAGQDENGTNEVVTLTHIPTGAEYGSGTRVGTVTFTLQDDDPTGVTLSETALSVPEAGTAVYAVALATQPGGRVTVAVGGTTAAITVDAAPGAGGPDGPDL